MLDQNSGVVPVPSSPMSPNLGVDPPTPADVLSPQLPPSACETLTASTSANTLSTDPLASAISLLNDGRKMRILILSSDTGGGHRASAQALRSAIEQLFPTQVHIDVVDFWVDLAAGPFCNVPQQYTFLAKHPWMWKFTYEFTRFPPGRAFAETVFNTFGHRNVRAAFQRYAPDLILSVHPLVNTLSHKVLRQITQATGTPPVPYVTVVTDLGGAHPTWFHKRCDMTYIPNAAVHRIATRVGLRDDRLRQLGLPVRPDFWDPVGDKRDLRARLGMCIDLPTVLAIGGGDGVGGLKPIATALANDLPVKLGHDKVQIVVICGKNEKLRSWLESRHWRANVIALGYVDNMSDWMAACDILCTKAGPGTIAEGLIRGLPIVITGFLPGQEEANVKYVVDQRVGVFAKKTEKVVSHVAAWLSDVDLLHDMSERAQQLGRPTSSIDIAEDIIKVAKDRIEQNMRVITQQRRIQETREALARSGLSRFIPHRHMLLESGSSESHVLFRVKLLLKIVVGSFIARDAWRSGSRTPPSSPLEEICDRAEIDDDVQPAGDNR